MDNHAALPVVGAARGVSKPRDQAHRHRSPGRPERSVVLKLDVFGAGWKPNKIGETMEKPWSKLWKTMKNYGKTMKNYGKHMDKTMEKHEKLWNNPLKKVKVSIISIPMRIPQNPDSHGLVLTPCEVIGMRPTTHIQSEDKPFFSAMVRCHMGIEVWTPIPEGECCPWELWHSRES